METSNGRSTRYLNRRLDRLTRALLLAGALLLAAACLLPVWRIDVAPPADTGHLGLALYADRIEVVGAPEEGLELRSDETPGFQWMPFVLGGLTLLFLRGAAIGTGRSVVDLAALFAYFVVFSAWSFAGRLDFYGRYLAAATERGVSLFVPPLVGHQRIDGVDVFSLPAAGALTVAGAGVLLAWALVRSWRRSGTAETAVRASEPEQILQAV
jgi:hypothetical protein